jgi:hypothetical protein
LLDSMVEVGAFSWKPYKMIHDCARSGGNPRLTDAVAPGLAAEGTRAWLAYDKPQPPRAVLRSTPAAEDFPRLATALGASSWASALERPLSGGVESLQALEPLIDRICRCAMPLRGNEPWVVRLCILVGAYVGEAVRRRVGGTWSTRSRGSSEERYVLSLPGGFEAEPVAATRERVIAQNGVRLAGYATALLRKN